MTSASASVSDELFDMLRRLDQLLAQALQATHDSGSTNGDLFRGLHIGPDDVARWIAREPGVPLFLQGVGSRGDAREHLMKDSSRFVWLAESFGLSQFDLSILAIALAPHVDLRYESLYSYLQDDVTRRQASVDLALNLLCSSPREKLSCHERLGPESPLIRHGILHLVPPADRPNAPLLLHSLQVDLQIVDVVLGLGGLILLARGKRGQHS